LKTHPPVESGKAKETLKVVIDTDVDAQKLKLAVDIIRSDLLPWEDEMSESMQGGHGEVLTIAIDCLEKVRQGIEAVAKQESLVS
jgi:hypothetical protein